MSAPPGALIFLSAACKQFVSILSPEFSRVFHICNNQLQHVLNLCENSTFGDVVDAELSPRSGRLLIARRFSAGKAEKNR
jgi:hypothetical protein